MEDEDVIVLDGGGGLAFLQARAVLMRVRLDDNSKSLSTSSWLTELDAMVKSFLALLLRLATCTSPNVDKHELPFSFTQLSWLSSKI